MGKLLIATNNPYKLREFRQILGGIPFPLTSPDEEGLSLDVAEVGTTFAENAVLKARAFAEASGLLALADDSGLEVDALEGEPGVRSARFAGEGAGARECIDLLLKRMAGIPWEERTARFRCVVALAHPDGSLWLEEGRIEGIITPEPRGSGGFGYDPVFFVPELGRTMAELPPETKNAISHRAQAARAVRRRLESCARQGDRGADA